LKGLQYQQLIPTNFLELDNSTVLGSVALGITDIAGFQAAITKEIIEIVSGAAAL